MATPFSAALSMVLQYRGIVAIAMYLSGLLLMGCIALQYLLADRWRMFCGGLLRMADGCLGAGVILALWLTFGSGYRSWTAAGGISVIHCSVSGSAHSLRRWQAVRQRYQLCRCCWFYGFAPSSAVRNLPDALLHPA